MENGIGKDKLERNGPKPMEAWLPFIGFAGLVVAGGIGFGLRLPIKPSIRRIILEIFVISRACWGLRTGI